MILSVYFYFPFPFRFPLYIYFSPYTPLNLTHANRHVTQIPYNQHVTHIPYNVPAPHTYIHAHTDEDVTVLSRGVTIPIYYLNGGNESTQLWSKNATDKQIKKIRLDRNEPIYALVKVQTNLNDDQLYISATFASRSLRCFRVASTRQMPSVEASSVVFGNTAMPSVIYADPGKR
jgi:hypothetical protein